MSVDKNTENLVQQVMRDNFEHATVIVLASRFDVIVQCDRVIVMNHGKLVEFDTPLNLIDDPKSKFSLMLQQTGESDPAKLRELAQSRADSKNLGVPPAGYRRNSSSVSSMGSLPGSLKGLF